MRTIVLSQGYYAMVSDEDFEWLSQRSWCVKESKRKRNPSIWYAIHSSRKHSHVYMHREIAKRCSFPEASRTDHVDGNGLNNQRSNLRPCSDSENLGNSRKTNNRSSRFKGVTWNKRNRKWNVRVTKGRETHWLGSFENEKAAAAAYDKGAALYFGEFANLNFK